MLLFKKVLFALISSLPPGVRSGFLADVSECWDVLRHTDS